MSDIFGHAVGEAKSFFMASPVGVQVDSGTGETYVASTYESVETVMGLLQSEDRAAIVDHALANGIVRAERLTTDDRVKSLDELRDAIAAKAIHSTVQADPEVMERVGRNRFEIAVDEMTRHY